MVSITFVVNFYYIYGWYYIYGFYYIYGWYRWLDLEWPYRSTLFKYCTTTTIKESDEKSIIIAELE